ncbi:alpha/beta fold hydrolase [Actinoalloteichus hymeniacidonis]|uniref:Alpha/beta hydrolase family protein n=1 Tax=Actinoalloteichus hymeniacidonis TaxID=340345 RepID=A0AAC9HNA9_9PSEU|nr:alpha/beta fold hydrolase [Actinoalloteichus hymeniacidonis]AOS62351.1 Alpha/beta hydrolase family protein [Actinoalloteichus hymeniacidonis]MBB5909621.1 pimeloyl-ACP methyl ester carboxylesterase [Actinoalloteichus hymeniacidonis]
MAQLSNQAAGHSADRTRRIDGAPTYVFVHGSGSNSFMWASIQRELALLGHRSHAVDLPGHGLDAEYSASYQAPQDLQAWANEPSKLAEVTLVDNVEAVLDVVRTVGAHGPVVLVGASLGGLTISGVADRAPEAVARLVYISAWSCVRLRNPLEYMAEPEFGENLLAPLAALNVGDPARLGVGRANYRTADPTLLPALKAAVMADATDAQFLTFLNILQPDESLQVMAGDATVHAETWGTVARSYVRLLQDRSLPVAMQDRLIAEADALTPDNRYDVHTVDSSHAGFVYRAREMAALLAGLPA